MKINDELIACYIEDRATPEERREVRKYLLDHPEALNEVLGAMSASATELVCEHHPQSDTSILMDNAPTLMFAKFSVSKIGALPASGHLGKDNTPQPKGLADRLSKMCDEIDALE